MIPVHFSLHHTFVCPGGNRQNPATPRQQVDRAGARAQETCGQTHTGDRHQVEGDHEVCICVADPPENFHLTVKKLQKT